MYNYKDCSYFIYETIYIFSVVYVFIQGLIKIHTPNMPIAKMLTAHTAHKYPSYIVSGYDSPHHPTTSYNTIIYVER